MLKFFLVRDQIRGSGRHYSVLTVQKKAKVIESQIIFLFIVYLADIKRKRIFKKY